MLHVTQSNKDIKTIPSDTARAVYRQMLPDFPGHAIAWVKQCFWTGPKEVSLDSIDMENRANWVASREPDKVKQHMQLIQEGKSKPIILGKFPGHDKLIIIDAHHRFLAYEALGKDAMAYIATIPPELTEQAMTCHGHQYSGNSKLEGT